MVNAAAKGDKPRILAKLTELGAVYDPISLSYYGSPNNYLWLIENAGLDCLWNIEEPLRAFEMVAVCKETQSEVALKVLEHIRSRLAMPGDNFQEEALKVLDAQNDRRMTPLMRVIANGLVEVAETLIDLGADLEFTSRYFLS